MSRSVSNMRYKPEVRGIKIKWSRRASFYLGTASWVPIRICHWSAHKLGQLICVDMFQKNFGIVACKRDISGFFNWFIINTDILYFLHGNSHVMTCTNKTNMQVICTKMTSVADNKKSFTWIQKITFIIYWKDWMTLSWWFAKHLLPKTWILFFVASLMSGRQIFQITGKMDGAVE